VSEGEVAALAAAYRITVDTLVEVRMYAEKLIRSPVPSEQAVGADLLQIIDRDASA
jgi:hypothetical protein